MSSEITKHLFIAQVIIYLAGGISGFLFSRNPRLQNRSSHLFAACGGVFGLLMSLLILTGTPGFILKIPTTFLFGPLVLQLDLLSAFFTLVLSLLAVAVSWYAIGYVKEFEGRKDIRLLGLFYNTFLLSMLLVMTVRNAFYFLVFWEVMSLVSYFLVIFEHEKAEARWAGMVYFVMTHAGTAFIAIGFWLLFIHTGSFSFDLFHLGASSLSPLMKNIIFICALIGFGTKAGLVPLHIWLPKAHPQAPSHVSALMSGVMIKTAVYILLRFLFDFLGTPFVWWGFVILTVAIVTTLTGILYAVMERDLKRLLAFSSIENIGIIFLSLGMAVIFTAEGELLLASFALIAGLYHVLNHATFKGLLFLGAGSILSKTHTKNMEQLGGLIKKMPWTAACFLVGAVAICALPPLNGFVSEWMVFISLLLGFKCSGEGIRFFTPILAALLGLAGALAVACFVKAFGITFLGMPRSPEACEVKEVGVSMRAGMVILALSCFGFALGAPVIIPILDKVIQTLGFSHLNLHLFARETLLKAPDGFGRYSPLFAFLILMVIGLGTVGVIRLLRKGRVSRMAPSWDCGLPGLTPRMQYTATGYSKPIQRIFSFFYRPTRRVELEEEGHAVLRTAQRFETRITPFFEDVLYRPTARLVLLFSDKAKRIQTGQIQLYLSYIFITLILLLLFAR